MMMKFVQYEKCGINFATFQHKKLKISFMASSHLLSVDDSICMNR